MRCAKACKTLPFLQAFSYFPKTSPFSKSEEQPSSVITNYLLSKFHGLDSLHFALESRQANFVQTLSVVPRVLQITN
jgi:hypothetical protein